LLIKIIKNPPASIHQWQKGCTSFAFLYIFDNLKLNENSVFGDLAIGVNQ
jgi:hypothetical protein